MGHNRAPLGTPTWLSFISDERHLTCAFWLAEKVARTISVAEVRVDVFVTKGRPNDCAINEISISSGSLYVGHMPTLARLWSEPFLQRKYHVFDSGKPIYLQTTADLPNVTSPCDEDPQTSVQRQLAGRARSMDPTG